jgi:hypothetical protein
MVLTDGFDRPGEPLSVLGFEPHPHPYTPTPTPTPTLTHTHTHTQFFEFFEVFDRWF